MNQREFPKPGDSMARSPLLLIDDNVENLKLLERLLEWAGYANVRCCTSALEGLAAIDAFKPDLIILDLRMPEVDGYEFLRRVREDAAVGTFIPILVFTADLTSEARTQALELGAADFLTKPGDAVEIQLRVRNFLRMRKMHIELENQNQILESKVRERTELLTIARLEAIEVLASACEYRDDDTGHHARRVGTLSAGIAGELGLDADFVESIQLAAPLHDLGKIGIPDNILFKPAKLSDEEYAVMRRHAALGAALLGEKKSPLLQLAREIAEFHHERWDGKGYDSGRSGLDIPLSARIVSVADTYDAITNDRPYRKGRTQFEALEEIKAMAGTQFDPAVVEALYRFMNFAPSASRQAA